MIPSLPVIPAEVSLVFCGGLFLGVQVMPRVLGLWRRLR